MPFPQPHKLMIKYVCRSGIFNPNIRDKWLPRWYDVPFEECLFYSDMKKERDIGGMCSSDAEILAKKEDVMLLIDLPKGTDYKQHLKILKTERLLDGNDIR